MGKVIIVIVIIVGAIILRKVFDKETKGKLSLFLKLLLILLGLTILLGWQISKSLR